MIGILMRPLEDINENNSEINVAETDSVCNNL